MCIRDMSGEIGINDVLTQNPEAVQARLMHLAAVRSSNAHFVSQICQSHLFQAALQNCLQSISQRDNPDDKRAIIAVHVAQAVLIGMHVHEQLIDKKKKGLI
jgi:hypothetical protein